MYRSYRLNIGRLETEKAYAEEMNALHLRTIRALALAIEAKDQTTHNHLRRVEHYAVEIGKDLGLNESELQALRAASQLHDIGKLAIPEHIITKPGKLTPQESGHEPGDRLAQSGGSLCTLNETGAWQGPVWEVWVMENSLVVS